MRKLISLAMIASFLSVSACNKTEAPKVETAFKPTATIQELMQSVIDPHVDAIWNAVQTVVSTEGTQEIRPQSDEDWAVLKNHAITLREVSNLLIIEGRKVAVEGASTSIHSSELAPQQIEKLIAEQRPAFIKNAHDLHDAVTIALSAIEEKNVDKLEAAGGVIEHACEQCHSQFWYPGDKRPSE